VCDWHQYHPLTRAYTTTRAACTAASFISTFDTTPVAASPRHRLSAIRRV